MISHKILKETCELLRVATQASQWKSTTECISWFRNILNKNRKVFIKYDIKDFYLSITENILLDALMFAKSFVCLNPDHIALILHCRKSVLFHGGEAWINKSDTGNFDVLEGSFDRTEVAELIGIFILNKINKIVHIDDHGLYRDNGLIVAPENKRSSDPPPKKKTT